MIYFKYPAVLWALFLIIIPLIIHLINLHRHKILYFSNTQLLKRVEKESRKNRKLNQILLLTVRMLTIALLVVAFAVPQTKDDGESGDITNNYITFFIDNSLSMQAENAHGNLLEQTKLQINQYILKLPETAQLRLITHQGVVAEQIYPQLVPNVLNKITYSATTISPQGLLQLLNKQSYDAERQNMIFSDLQSNYWETFFELADTTLKVMYVQIKPESPENTAIDTVWFDTPFHNAEQEHVINIKLTNYGLNNRSGIPVKLVLNDTVFSIVTVDLGAGESKTLQLSYTSQNIGWVTGHIEIDDMPIVFDNQYFFSYFVTDRRNVLMAGSENDYTSLLDLYEVAKYIDYTVAAGNRITPALLDKASCVIVKNEEQLSTTIVEQLLGKAETGASIAFIMSEKTVAAAEQIITQKLGFPNLTNAVRKQYNITGINLQHFLFRNSITSVNKETRMPTVEYIRQFSSAIPYSNRIIVADTGEPLLVSKAYGKGQVFIFTSDITLNSDFNRHPVFVPLFINMVQFAGNSLDPVFTITANSCLDLPVIGHQTSELAFGFRQMQVPHLYNSELAKEIIPRISQNGIATQICLHNQVQNSGIWHLKNQDQTLIYIAFNYSRNESSCNYITENMYKNILMSDNNIIHDNNKSDTLPFAVWKIAVAAVLLLLLFETYLMSKR